MGTGTVHKGGGLDYHERYESLWACTIRYLWW